MSLPELDLQILYGRLAWAVVLAALVVALWPRAWRLSRRTVALLVAGSVVLHLLPNEASLAYWIGLAFQWPSALLVSLCLVRLHGAWQGNPTMAAITPELATIIAVAGAALYIDAIGWTAQGFYYWGFEPHGAPLAALLIAAACSVAAVRGHARPQALAVLLAVVIFAIPRLPTGNIWDALLDPLLWGWALVSLAIRGWRRSGIFQTRME